MTEETQATQETALPEAPAKPKARGPQKAGKGKKRGKRAKSKGGPGKCGTYMYFSKKARKCMDARNK